MKIEIGIELTSQEDNFESRLVLNHLSEPELLFVCNALTCFFETFPRGWLAGLKIRFWRKSSCPLGLRLWLDDVCNDCMCIVLKEDIFLISEDFPWMSGENNYALAEKMQNHIVNYNNFRWML